MKKNDTRRTQTQELKKKRTSKQERRWRHKIEDRRYKKNEDRDTN